MQRLSVVLLVVLVTGTSAAPAADAPQAVNARRVKLVKSSKRSPRLPDVLPIQPIYSQWGGGHGTEGRLFHTPNLNWALKYNPQEVDYRLLRGPRPAFPEIILWFGQEHLRAKIERRGAFQCYGIPFQLTGYVLPSIASAEPASPVKDYLVTTREVFDMHVWVKDGPPQVRKYELVWQEANTGIYAALPVVLSNYQPPPGCDPAAVYVLVDTSNRVGILAYDLPKGKWVATKYPKPVQLTEHYARDQAGNNVYIGTNRGRLVYDSKHRTLTLDRQPLRRKPSPKVAHK